MGQVKRHATKIRPKAVGGVNLGRIFPNFDKCRPEVVDDVMSRVAVDQVAM